MAVSSSEMTRLAKIGAQSRLEALRAEESNILRAFPELGRGTSARKVRVVRSVRREMSPAQKRAVSKRMKAYWAERRAKKAAKATQGKG